MFLKYVMGLVIVSSAWISSTAQTPESLSQKYDKDAKIIYKPMRKPGLTKELKTSGYCCLIVDIDEEGTPKNVRTQYCTHDKLASFFAARTKSLKFSPALIDGEPVYRKNKTLKPGYERYKGKRLIAGPNGFLDPKYPDIMIPRRPKNERAKKKWVRKYFNNKRTCYQFVS